MYADTKSTASIESSTSRQPSISKFEGDWPDGAGLTLIRFPSREILEHFWKSDEYQSIIDLRTARLPANLTIGFSHGWRGEVAS
ncbi:DUF1330 domain-containing protein [Ruegeria atlantica]|uniref:DUF1330 domain-containing protein n=1 Tax=Ruegeria atlantica TaxID=81569 RepID=UPI003D7D60ED